MTWSRFSAPTTRVIMVPDCWRWSSLQLKAQADFWHPAGFAASAERAATQKPPGYDRGTRTRETRVTLRRRVPGRGPTQPIAPYHAINYSAEVSL
jgi:hypothetical protein